MNKNQFIKELEKRLERIRKEEREDILKDYIEHIDQGVSKGKTENQIIDSLGNIDDIAKEILTSYNINIENNYNNKPAKRSAIAKLFVFIGVLFLNLIFVLAPYIGVLAVVFSLAITGVVSLFAPLILVLSYFISEVKVGLFDIFTSIAFVGIGILMLFATINLGRFLMKITKKYLKFNVELIKGEKNAY